MTIPPSQRFRERLLEAIPPFAAEFGWNERSLEAAARAAGLTAAEARLGAPRGALDVMDAFADRADQRMLAQIGEFDLKVMKVRERVRAALAARIEAQRAYKEAARTMTRALVRQPGEGARILWRTADRIWRALGDPSTDGNFYSKRAILAGVLASTYARWFTDKDPESAATFAFLDARIENVMQFERFKAKRLKPLGEMAEHAVGFMARMRYGR
jgi:ubiquinone biosynthesis protein COQ9